jgi:hypothetical protein
MNLGGVVGNTGDCLLWRQLSAWCAATSWTLVG